MKMTRLIPRTRRDVTDGLTTAHALLLRSGCIRQVDRGIFVLAPLGFRAWRNLREIIFSEMERDGVLNIQMPILQPQELWQQTGRWDKYVSSGTMFQTHDAHSGTVYGLAPTAEEVVTWLVASEVDSWRDLGEHGLHFHQIGWKFRDEVRPHGGLLRGREFDMSDAYSFDQDEAGMRHSFTMYRDMYVRIFERAGLNNCISVQADSGAIGGSGSAEFMAVSDVGEDTLLTCPECGYGANVERCDSAYSSPLYATTFKPRRTEHTPNTMTVEQLEELFAADGITAQHMIKTIILTVNADSGDSFEVAVCIRGDLEINLVKVRNNIPGADDLCTAAASVVIEVTGAEVGFAGPLGLKNVRQILFDKSTEPMTNFLCGLNRTDYHALDVNFDGSDDNLSRPDKFYDLHTAEEGHGCPECDSGKLTLRHGIEVGHIFMLQRGYAESMGATFRDVNGDEQTIWMGCYGIGVTRLLQAVIDQNNDADGIIWPLEVAPYKVIVTPINFGNAIQREIAEEIYRGLRKRGLEVILDDRDLRAGPKFKDADLIGIPWRVTVGRKAGQRLVEVRDRRNGKVMEVPVEWAIKDLQRTADAADLLPVISGVELV